MRTVWLVAGALAVGFSARAQNAPIQATPLPPLQQQWNQEGSAPVSSGILAPPGSPDSSVPSAPDQPPVPSVAPPQTMERPNVWVPAGVAKLQALDKVNAQAATLTIKVGESATFGSLTIKVKACVVRPTDQPADAAAWLDVTDSHPDTPAFNSWMLEAEPSVSMMQNPIYDLRVSGCT
jgi:hypothetical protein